jgi:hypothetical protein
MLKAPFLSIPRTVAIAFTIAIALLLAAPSAGAAPACACCAEPGEWFERTGRLQPFEIEELRGVQFDKTAHTYLNAAGFEGLKGFPLEYDSFNLSSILKPSLALTMTFKAERGETGALTLFLPKVATFFGADLHDMPEGSAGPILYKEWRFEGAASGSGVFARGIARGTKFQLVLQGRGNNCLSSSDFKNWRLDIMGARASYAVYGSLKTQ